jgi:hypothetical protein
MIFQRRELNNERQAGSADEMVALQGNRSAERRVPLFLFLISVHE